MPCQDASSDDRLTTQESQTVLDPFMGSGTTAIAARRLKRHFIGFEIVPEFHAAAQRRLDEDADGRQSLAPGQVQASLFAQ